MEAPTRCIGGSHTDARLVSTTSNLLRGDILWLLGLVATSTCTQAVRPAASYHALELGGSPAAVGAVAAAYALLTVFIAIPLGLAIDRLGAKRFLSGGVAVLGISALLCAFSTSIFALAVGQAFVGVGQVSFVLSAQSIVANRRGREAGFARLTLAGGTGQLLGPLIAGLMVGLPTDSTSISGTTIAFLTGSAFALVGMILAALGTRGLHLGPPNSSPRPTEALTSLARAPGLGQALSMSVVTTTSVEMMVTYLPVLGASRGISPEVIGSILGVRAVAGLASRVVITRMLARFGRLLLVVGSLFASGTALLGIALTARIALMFALALVVGFGLGVGAPLTMAIVARKAPEGARTAAMAVRLTCDRTGLLVFALLLGGLATVVGAGTVFVAVATTLLGSAEWVRRSPLVLSEDQR
jgi:MFS family permease